MPRPSRHVTTAGHNLYRKETTGSWAGGKACHRGESVRAFNGLQASEIDVKACFYDNTYDIIHIRALEHVEIGKRDRCGAGKWAVWFEATRGRGGRGILHEFVCTLRP